jgi:uncharacterized protein (DUF2384 family)
MEPQMQRRSSVQPAVSREQVLTKALVNTATTLDLPKGKVAHILGVSPATVSRLFAQTYLLSPARKEWDFSVLLIRLFRSLDAIVGGNTEDARKWLNSENQALAGKKPADLIESTEGLVRVVNYLDACRGIV